MPPLEISLEGKSSITRQPERCALRFKVRATGPNRESVSKEVTATSNEINQLFKELSPKTETGETITGSPVTSFSSTSLQTQSHAPKDNKGESLPTVYYANLSLNALFQDFTKLNEIVGKLILYSNIEIQSLDWCLTEATQKALSSKSREEAMRDAVQRANDYTRVIGREVVAVKVSELQGGVQFDMNHGRNYTQPQQQAMAQQMQQQRRLIAGLPAAFDSPASNLSPHSGDSTALNLSPQLIRYTNSVQVVFEGVDSRKA
ncbi:uncharacterized protein N7479_005869 [Penicillium vulpinum]|uniref:Uncharacterized protein n=1 Tax=Penicillium vulpinum TaxID=29845 RepID=A0A1V6SDZ1_9EURO|nr:uncharacterized protein N7479_005869 [Penicillium vulpinum]KAJ5958719.1 hypothetical protein N7479_005869 [Penicillium vulpinum]OQE12245.1 hypothetical protein PENVUL_c001G04516 [Penicillium vulpinum]